MKPCAGYSEVKQEESLEEDAEGKMGSRSDEGITQRAVIQIPPPPQVRKPRVALYSPTKI